MNLQHMVLETIALPVALRSHAFPPVMSRKEGRGRTRTGMIEVWKPLALPLSYPAMVLPGANQAGYLIRRRIIVVTVCGMRSSQRLRCTGAVTSPLRHPQLSQYDDTTVHRLFPYSNILFSARFCRKVSREKSYPQFPPRFLSLSPSMKTRLICMGIALSPNMAPVRRRRALRDSLRQ